MEICVDWCQFHIAAIRGRLGLRTQRLGHVRRQFSGRLLHCGVTAEFAGMNIEGSVKLGFRKELATIEDPEGCRVEFERRVSRAYVSAKAINAGVGGGLDDVIDPADTRSWIASSLKRLPPKVPRTGKKYRYIDTW